MSISLEYALENKNQPAVLCCRAEEGTVLSEHNLEDPAIFDDLVDSGLLDLTDAITIEQALGGKLLGTFDSLTALTADKVEIVEKEDETPKETVEDVPAEESVNGRTARSGGVLYINIEEGKGIHIELPC